MTAAIDEGAVGRATKAVRDILVGSDPTEGFEARCRQIARAALQAHQPVSTAIDADAVEQLRYKLRMIVSHATGGHSQDIDASVNDICVLISETRNHVFAHGKEVGARDALQAQSVSTAIDEGAVERALTEFERKYCHVTQGVVLPDGSWRTARRKAMRAALAAMNNAPDSETDHCGIVEVGADFYDPPNK